jgi:membrane-bound serine protease (ClpP class)
MGIIVILFAVGILMLVAEIFIPSHGVLSVAATGFLVAGIVQTFRYAGRDAGIASVFACLVIVPSLAYVAIKYWPKSPIGRRIAPPNPTLTEHDTSVPVAELARLVGHAGTSTTTLRPVGVCMIDGRRVNCIAEYGMIDAGKKVRATRVAGANLAVEEVQS